MACSIEISTGLPILTSCPGNNEYMLFANAVGGLDVNGGFTVGYAIRTWATIFGCIQTRLFGEGGLTILGTDLDINNEYFNTDMPTDILIFYNGLGRFLIYGSEWKYINNTDTSNGIKILIASTFGASDYFTILANPNNP
jgi:hypothetical protein